MRNFAKIILIFTGSICGGMLAILLFAIVTGDPIEHALKSSYGILFLNESAPLRESDTKLLSKLTSSGAILTPSQLMTEMSSFYERVITILTGIIAILGMIAYMYVRSVSEEGAAKLVDLKVEKHLQSEEHKSKVALILRPEIDKLAQMKDDVEDLYDAAARQQEGGLAYSINDLYDKVRSIESALRNRDTVEAQGSDLNLTGPSRNGGN